MASAQSLFRVQAAKEGIIVTSMFMESSRCKKGTQTTQNGTSQIKIEAYAFHSFIFFSYLFPF